jgi:hypothetical protein
MKQRGPLPRVVAGERAHDGKPAWIVENYFYCLPFFIRPARAEGEMQSVGKVAPAVTDVRPDGVRAASTPSLAVRGGVLAL